MEGLIIKTHDFEVSKNKLKAFSKQTPEDLELSKVDISGGIFGWVDHKVTGYELNELTTQIQKHLISYNKLHVKLIQEFGQVYNALEALDKDYIQAILISIKAAEKANSEAKIAQKDIAQTIEVQKKTINVLNQFKTKIESYKHLSDVDNLWNGFKESQKEISDITSNISTVVVKTKDNSQKINVLNKLKDQIEEIKHLKNIDELWSSSLLLKKEVSSINKQISNITKFAQDQNELIEVLSEFNNTLEGYEHLKDIDEIWNRCNDIDADISSSKAITNRHEGQINSLINILQDTEKQNNESNEKIYKKLKLAYVLSGCSIGITIIGFTLIMLKVI